MPQTITVLHEYDTVDSSVGCPSSTRRNWCASWAGPRNRSPSPGLRELAHDVGIISDQSVFKLGNSVFQRCQSSSFKRPYVPNRSLARFSAIATSSPCASACCSRHWAVRRAIFPSKGSPSSSLRLRADISAGSKYVAVIADILQRSAFAEAGNVGVLALTLVAAPRRSVPGGCGPPCGPACGRR